MSVVAGIPRKGLLRTGAIVAGLFFSYQLQRGANSITALTAGILLGATVAVVAGFFWVVLSTRQSYLNRLPLSGLVLWLVGIGVMIWLLNLPLFGDAGGVCISILLIGAMTLIVKWVKRERLT
jgi:uncharacterized membrane protein